MRIQLYRKFLTITFIHQILPVLFIIRNISNVCRYWYFSCNEFIRCFNQFVSLFFLCLRGLSILSFKNCTIRINFANSRPSASNFKSYLDRKNIFFSQKIRRILETKHHYLTVTLLSRPPQATTV
jgi:hypothetical protein